MTLQVKYLNLLLYNSQKLPHELIVTLISTFDCVIEERFITLESLLNKGINNFVKNHLKI
jgi:hypothetical protein